jgi:hypothetical protein
MAGLASPRDSVVGGKVKMTTEQLNELLKRAIESLQDERATLITFVDPTKPLLPEAYWRDQYDRATLVRHNAAADAAADLFERSLEIAREKMRRREEDQRLASMSVDELLDDVPTLWQPHELTTWGTMPMRRSGSAPQPPTQGPQAPSYDFECYQCGRPITDQHHNDWVDHAGSRRCDGALMLDHDWEPIHMPKPWHGEEEDEDA